MKYDFLEMDLSWIYKNILPKDVPLYYHRLYTYEDVQFFVKNINRFRNNNDLLILDNTTDSQPSVIETIYKDLICNQNFPANRIWYISSAFNVDYYINLFATKYNKATIKTIYSNLHETLTGYRYFTVPEKIENFKYFAEQRLQNKQFEKLFVSLNRRWELHRLTLIGLLKGYNLLDRGFVSFSTKHPVSALLSNRVKFNKKLHHVLKNTNITSIDNPSNTKKIWEATIPYIINTYHNKKITEIFTENNISDIPELELTKSQLFTTEKVQKPNESYGWGDDLDYFHNNSVLSLITETFYGSEYISPHSFTHFMTLQNENPILFTEKVYRPMLYRHPFIMLSVPNYLKSLQSLGYKTFHPYINESYDNEVDDGKRFIMVMEELKRLSTYDNEQIYRFVQNTAHITEHNFTVFQQNYNTFFSNIQ
jgi:hypothetical protein